MIPLRPTRRGFRCFVPVVGWLGLLFVGRADDTATPERNLVQHHLLDSRQPCFVPTHPRVTTTLRFPGPIGHPEGRGFVEDEKKQSGEYLVSWTRGDAHLTLSPLAGAGPLNLNIPYGDATYVFYFYPVEHQFQAVAVLVLAPTVSTAVNSPATQAASIGFRVERCSGPPPAAPVVAVTPARLIGLLDRLKLLAQAPATADLLARAAVFRLEALAPAIGPAVRSSPAVPPPWPQLDIWQERDHGPFALQLRLIVADRALSCLAFAVEVINRSDQTLGFHTAGFAVRVGSRFFPARLAEGPAILTPGERRVGHFAIQLPPDLPLQLENPWLVSYELVSPRLNPGAALAQAFAREKTAGETVSGTRP